jgi:hypothetical protein
MAKTKKSSKHAREQRKPPAAKAARRGIRQKGSGISVKQLLERLHSHRGFLVLLGVALFMRVVALGRQSLWIDEMCCWNDAAGSIRHIMATAHWVVFLLEKASQNLFGPSEFALRLPSALVGTAGIVCIYLAALQITSRQTAFLAALLMTFSPINVYYSQDANYYGMMMGFAAVTLYLLFRFFRTRNLVGLLVLFILWIAVNYLNFGTHPFNIFLSGAEIIVFIAWFFLDREFRGYWGGELKRFLAKPAIAVPVLAIAVIGAGFVLYRLAPRSAGYIKGMLNASQGTRMAENFEATPAFFLKLATDYGLVFQDYTKLNFAFTFVFLAFFVVGVLWYARRSRFVFLLTVLGCTVPFVGLYVARVHHFYHPRYTSFLVPIYLLAAAQGVAVISGFLADRIVSARKNQIRWFVICGILAVFGVVAVPNLVRYYTGEKQGWRNAVEFLRENLKPGDKVTSYLFANNSSLVFYFNRLGMDISAIEKLPEVRGAAWNDLYLLKKMCLGGGDVYFCTSYTRYEPPLIINWVEKHFDRVLDLPSLHPNEINREGKEVIVYRSKYKGAFVFPPFEYRFEQSSVINLPSSRQDSLSTETVFFAKELLFDRAGTYDLSLTFEEAPARELPILLLVDGKISSERRAHAGAKSLAEAYRFEIESGVHSIAFAQEAAKGLSPFASPFTFTILPTWNGKIEVSAYDADVAHPTSEKRVAQVAGRWAYVLKRNSYLRYENIMLPEAGRYYFEISAVNDKPGPVLIEVLWDGKPIGIVSFDKADGSWGERVFPFSAGAGKHAVTISFINNNTASATGDDSDNDAIIAGFEIVQERIVGDEARDERVQLLGKLQEMPAELSRALEDGGRGGKLPAGWRLEPAMTFSYGAKETSGEKTAIQFEIAPFSQGVMLMSPPEEVSPGKILYFAGEIRVKDLENHSANMQVLYFNAGKQLLSAQWVNVEGVTRTTDWVRFCYFRAVPANARWAIIAYVVYPNSRRPSESAGRVAFSDLRFESY